MSSETTSKIVPRVAVLWNGVTLEELGLADLLKSADLTLTLGRSNPSKKLPTGKPKVGGATLVFLLPDEKSAQKILRLLYLNPRPMLTVGFGYKGSQSFWLGGVGVRTRPNIKQFSRVQGYKIDTVSWDYSASFPTVTLNGMAGHTLGMTEHRSPRSWAGKTLIQISEDISKQLGFTIRISGKVPAAVRLENAMQFSGESMLDAMDRLTRLSGATLHLSTEVASATPGASKAYQYTIEGRPPDAEDIWAEDQAQVRTVLTIKSIEEEFVDLDNLEQSTPVKIAWAPSISPHKFASVGGRLSAEYNSYDNAPDHVAVSIRATEDNVARTYASAGGVTKTAKVQKGTAGTVGTGNKEVQVMFPSSDSATNQILSGPLLYRSVSDEDVAMTEAPLKGQHATVSAVPETMGGKKMTEAQLKAALYSAGLKTRLVIELSPGAPELIPGAKIEVMGTYTHDGFYGVEEARNVLEGQGGLKTTLTVRPLLPGGTDRGKSAKKGAAKDGTKPKNGPGSDVLLMFPADDASTGKIMDTPLKVRIVSDDQVPAAPDEAALVQDVAGGGN